MVLFDTLKKKIFCIVSIVAYIAGIIVSHECFAGVKSEIGKISTDGEGLVILLAVISAIAFALWIRSNGDISTVLIPFIGALVGIVASGLLYLRYAVFVEAADTMDYHSTSGWDYTSAERSSFFNLAEEFQSDAEPFLVFAIILWVVTAIAIFFTLKNIRKSN